MYGSVETTPDYFKDAYERIKSLRDAEAVLREVASEGKTPDWVWVGTIVRRAHEVGYQEGKRYERERLKILLGLE